MKVIFLDIDGVITDKSYMRFDATKMKMIKGLCIATEAKIVVSSSWRRGNLADTISELTGFGNSYVPVPYALSDLTIDITPYVIASETGERGRQFHVQRGVEIDLWLKDHDVENYVILDDENDMLYDQASHFVHINCKEGLTIDDCFKAVDILNNKIKY